MANNRNRRVAPIALMIIIIIISIAALVYATRFMFFSANGVATTVDVSQSALISTTADRAVLMSVRGPIVADEDFRSYSIRITPNERVLTVYKGYLDQPIDNITLGNNIPAYEQFVYALSRVNFMKNGELTGESNDTRGVCADDFLYQFQILKGDKSIKKLWTTACSSSRGSLGIKVSSVDELFFTQIPGADSKIGDLW